MQLVGHLIYGIDWRRKRQSERKRERKREKERERKKGRERKEERQKDREREDCGANNESEAKSWLRK